MKLLLIAGGLLLSVSVVSAQTPATTATSASEGHAIVVLPDAVEWVPAPPSIPAGARVAVIEGDPSKPGPFTMRIWMPDGYRIAPHSHPSNERVTVISGTFVVGMGDTFDASSGTELPAGTYAALAPGTNHYAWTRGETIIQLNNVGPWSLTYVNPADDPRNQAQP